MTGQKTSLIDDETLILQILDRDEEGLERLLEMYVPKATNYLIKHYGDTLSDIDIDAALYQAADRVWRYAKSFDPDRGSLKSWFMRIVQTQAFDIIKDQKKHTGVEFDLEQYGQPEEDCDDAPLDNRKKQRLDDLEYVVEHKLKGLQQAIIRADLKSKDVASADRLARIHNTSKNSVYVSRKKARENIKKYITERECQRQSKGGGR